MKPLPDKVTIQCQNCFGMIDTTLSELRVDNQLVCYHCFHTQSVDVEKLVKGLTELMKKVRGQKGN